jgi:DNA-binding CsgD family transcriptional regulator
MYIKRPIRGAALHTQAFNSHPILSFKNGPPHYNYCANEERMNRHPTTSLAEAVPNECEDSARLNEAQEADGRSGNRSRPVPAQMLSRRQTQVAALVAKGYGTREIAEHLSISTRTVEHHIAAIFARTGLRTRLRVAATFRLNELADPEHDRSVAVAEAVSFY